MADDACAYCADQSMCLTVSEIFEVEGGCRGTVFDAPCPESFVGVNRVVGNLLVESDPSFGGGEFHLDGQSADGGSTWEASLAEDGFALHAAASVAISAGNKTAANTAGGSIAITAGDGQSADRGAGGSVDLKAGNGFGETTFGNAGLGGHVLLQAGALLPSVPSTTGQHVGLCIAVVAAENDSLVLCCCRSVSYTHLTLPTIYSV